MKKPLTHEQRVENHNKSVMRLYQRLYNMLNEKRELEHRINDVILAISYLEK